MTDRGQDDYAMPEFITDISSWFGDHPAATLAIFVGSAVTFVATLLLMPLFIRRIPEDYFAHESRPPSVMAEHQPAVYISWLIIRHVLGVVLIVVGIAMLVLPGQGILTILVGLILINFPGKYRLERWLVSKPRIARPMNWIRRRGGRPPLRVWTPPADGQEEA